MNFQEKQKSKNLNKNLVFTSLIAIIIIFSVGYLGNNLLASIRDAKSFNNLFGGISVKYITPSELESRLSENDDLLLLDVRSQSDYEWEHMDDSINIPLNELGSHYDDINKETEIVTFCDASDCQYSKIAARRLLKEGFENVVVLDEGIEGMRSYGYKITKSDNKEVIDSIFKTESISLDELMDKQQKLENIIIYDIRSKDKFDSNHIEGALWVDNNDLMSTVTDISDKNEIIIVTDDFETAIKTGSQLFDNGYFNNKYLISD
jgi:rhodanese-related sulfurtransferase